MDDPTRPDLASIARRLRTAWPWCTECDTRTKTDEDGCCVSCGEDAVLPSEEAVEGQDHAADDIETLLAWVRELEKTHAT